MHCESAIVTLAKTSLVLDGAAFVFETDVANPALKDLPDLGLNASAATWTGERDVSIGCVGFLSACKVSVKVKRHEERGELVTITVKTAQALTPSEKVDAAKTHATETKLTVRVEGKLL